MKNLGDSRPIPRSRQHQDGSVVWRSEGFAHHAHSWSSIGLKQDWVGKSGTCQPCSTAHPDTLDPGEVGRSLRNGEDFTFSGWECEQVQLILTISRKQASKGWNTKAPTVGGLGERVGGCGGFLTKQEEGKSQLWIRQRLRKRWGINEHRSGSSFYFFFFKDKMWKQIHTVTFEAHGILLANGLQGQKNWILKYGCFTNNTLEQLL